ncbi:MAG: ABC transporter ATP-binding protein [Thermomicrobiales bacterium]
MKTGLRILRYLRPYWLNMVVFYSALFIAMGFQIAIPALIGRGIDNGVLEGDIDYVQNIVLLIIGAAILQAIFTFIRTYGTHVLAERVGNDLRDQLYAKFQELPFQFYDRSQTGQLMSRATDDINNIRTMLMFAVRAIVQAVGLMAVIIVIMLSTNIWLGLIALSTMPFLIWWALRFGVTIRPIFLGIQQQFGSMTSVLQENVAGGRVVRSFAQERNESERFEEELEELFQRNMRAARKWSFQYPLSLGVNGLSLAGVVWLGGYLVITGQVTIGTLVAFERYTAQLNEPVRWLGMVVDRTAKAFASADRIFETLDTKSAIANGANAQPLPNMNGVVRFNDVSFRYRGAREEALHNVSFEARPGQIVALVGATGSGKSSVISLIPRFYDTASGDVTIDGVNVRDIELSSLRDQIGIVMQETFLFSVTVGENIAYGHPEATPEQIVTAAKAARAHEFIMRMTEGYDTVVSERGVTLSGGQKQRLAIARALLVDPRILILDDSTASVDSETEHEIQRALRTMMRDRTSFVIAQRLGTIRDADHILVFDDGRIIQQGVHDELLKVEGFYRELYDLQLRDQEDAFNKLDQQVEEPFAVIPESDAAVLTPVIARRSTGGA